MTTVLPSYTTSGDTPVIVSEHMMTTRNSVTKR